MRNTERVHADIPNFKRCACAEDAAIEFHFELLFDRLLRQSIAKNRDLELGRKGCEPLDMV